MLELDFLHLETFDPAGIFTTVRDSLTSGVQLPGHSLDLQSMCMQLQGEMQDCKTAHV